MWKGVGNMKKMVNNHAFWLIIGIIVGIAVSIIYTNLTTYEIAPVDTRNLPEGVLIASASEQSLAYSSQDGFNYKPTKEIPVFKQFIIEKEHKDPGMLISLT